ncbi:potential dioxygenase [Uncinocarpus reesii 1704]|uniref:Potential dioxygenase n=1 Tax=Uncinocarpus reesii (strain UAMH 1704) TaxID=336963 RepID=C4JRF3_UNCRE|nr:putative dioxygenase [Uncinocarpus reesii 1704]EEP80200.1 potential dioxygenase [Uncinocarpus reesii 1704]
MSQTQLPIQLPIIDISNADPETGKAMIDAATNYGFLYVDSASTEISNGNVDSAFAMARKFFASPHEEKQQVRIGPNTNSRRRAFNFGEFKDNKAQQPLPPSLIPHEAEISNFMHLCRKTCDRILSLLALGLGIPPDWFTIRHDPSQGPSGVTFRFLYYPAIQSHSPSTPHRTTDIRAGAHSDYGSITLLFQRDGQPGLEIQTPTGEWAPVPVRPAPRGPAETGFPPILVNIGDILSYWTNGLLKSTVHRVVFPAEEQAGASPGKDRYSMAYFCHPLDDAELVPVPSRLVEQRRVEGMGLGPADGRIMTAREHLVRRLAATYGRSPDEYK